MLTLRDMNKVLGEIKGLNKCKAIYNRKKNALCYKLSKMCTQHRANVIERMMRDYLITMGNRVDYYGGSHPYDMMVNGKRVEIKSSLACRTSSSSYRYRFQNIKTSYFDQIILVFVTPHGIILKKMSSDNMGKKIATAKYHANGKTFEMQTMAN
jgi:hypothetical protein